MPKILSVAAVVPQALAVAQAEAAVAALAGRAGARGPSAAAALATPPRQAASLAARAIGECLGRGGVGAAGVSRLFFATSAHLYAPRLEEFLAAALPFPRSVRSSAVGAFGAAAALARASEALRARPRQRALVLCLELSSFAAPSLPDPLSGLTADAASAVLLAGDQTPEPGRAEILDCESLVSQSCEALAGWQSCSDGPYLSPPGCVSAGQVEEIRLAIERLLSRNGVSRAQLARFMLDVGELRTAGPLERSLALSPEDLAAAAPYRKAPARAPQLLRDLLESCPAGCLALLAGVGPGLGCEALLLRSL